MCVCIERNIGSLGWNILKHVFFQTPALTILTHTYSQRDAFSGVEKKLLEKNIKKTIAFN